jgi:hypothetical protein
LLIVPLTVNDAVPLLPDVIVKPEVVERVSVPCETDSVSESLPGLASVSEIALPFPVEKASEPFSARDAETGAVIDGASGLTLIATLVEADLLSVGSLMESESVSEPA